MSTITDLRSERERYWSQSRIGLFLRCSLKYAFSYVYHVQREFTPVALPFGSAVHRVLEVASHSRREGAPMPADDAEQLFGDIWQRELLENRDIRFGEDETAESLCDQGRAMLRCFLENVAEGEQVLAVSQAMAVPLLDQHGDVLEDPLIAELDLRVRNAEGSEIIVDWKTAARKWPRDKEHKEIQPTALLYAFSRQYGRIPGFRYDVVTKTKTPAFQQLRTERGEDDFARFVEIVKVVDAMVRAEHFLPDETGFMCGACQYRESCRRWHRERARLVSVAA